MTGGSPIVLFTGVQRMARGLRSEGFLSACLVEPGEIVTSPEELDFLVPYDPRDPESLKNWAMNWPHRDRVRAVINRRERRVPEHAVLNAAFGRLGVTPEQARICRDKYRFREFLSKHAPNLNPPFESVSDLNGLERPDIPFPFLIKPLNMFKSQLITLCSGEEDWNRAKKELPVRLAETGVRHGVDIRKGFILESYIEGTEFSVDSFVTEDREIVHTPPVALTSGRKLGVADDLHVAVRELPARLDGAAEKTVNDAVETIIDVLGLRSTPLHVDLILAENRVYALEAAPRIGGYRSEMMSLAYGCALDPLNLAVALGRPVEFKPQYTRAVSVIEFFPDEEGVLKEIRVPDDVKALESYHREKRRIPDGEKIGLARDGYRCPFFIVLSHSDVDRLQKDVQESLKSVRIEVERLQ